MRVKGGAKFRGVERSGVGTRELFLWVSTIPSLNILITSYSLYSLSIKDFHEVDIFNYSLNFYNQSLMFHVIVSNA